MAKILIVDDSMILRSMLKDVLVKLGHTIVAEASNGYEGIEAFKEHRPDLVMMDLNMPSMSGNEAILRLKQIDPDVRIVVCSAMGNEATVKKAIQSGARDFVVKPFFADRVAMAVDRVLASAH